MPRPRWLAPLLAALLVLLGVIWPASAHHKPNHGPTTTTSAPTTTTETTLPQTTTTTIGTTHTVTVDFNTTVATTHPYAFSVDESTYGEIGTYLTVDTTMQAKIDTLNPGSMRVGLKYAIQGDTGSAIQCTAAGCPTSVAGDTWIDTIKAVGSSPQVIVNFDTGSYPEADEDAAAMVQRWNITTPSRRVERWIIGNEPQGISVATYSARFIEMYDAMKAVDPTIKIGGPGMAFYDTSFLQGLIDNAGHKIDFIDFHSYGQGGSVTKTDAQLLSDTSSYTTNINDLRSRLTAAQPSRTIEIQIGEMNVDWDGDTRMCEQLTTVWGASAIGRVAATGSLAMVYASKNGKLGVLQERTSDCAGQAINTTLPMYHAVGMFTGEGLFRAFGASFAQVSTAAADVEVYASTSAKNLVVINKNPTFARNLTFRMAGYTSGTATPWRKDRSVAASAVPVQLSDITVTGGVFTAEAPPYSVTTFVLS